MKTFVIWDFTTVTARPLLQGISELVVEQGGAPIEWNIPGLGAAEGQIAFDLVERGIQDAERVIALVDLPNANVGWEIGLALGWGKRTALGHLGPSLPSWTRSGALNNLIVAALSEPESIRPLLDGEWRAPQIAPPGDAGATLLLCPGGAGGGPLRAIALRDHPGLRQLPDEGWALYDLGALLAPIARVVWVIAPYPDRADVRDGAENAANAVIAGIASASGREVIPLRSRDARPVVDVAPRERTFAELTQFKARLGSVLAAPVVVPPQPQPLLNVRSKRAGTLSAGDKNALRRLLVELFPDGRAVAAFARQFNLAVSGRGPIDVQWNDLITALANDDVELRPLLEAALRVDGESVLLRRLGGV